MTHCTDLMEQLAKQSPLYQPGVFWQEASKVMIEELDAQGVERFRRLASSLHFFVPTYGFPGNALADETMQSLQAWLDAQALPSKQHTYLTQFISGYSAALADYRTLAASEYSSTATPDLMRFSESQIGQPIEQFEIEGKRYSRSALNYLSGLSFLKKYADFDRIQTVMEIGGGFGTLGEIVHQTLPNTRYIDIDIPPTLCCSTYYLQQVFGDNALTTYRDTAQQAQIQIDQLSAASVLPSWQIERLQGKIDLFVNFISFQEMEPDIVQNYLSHVTRLQAEWVLLRNMREGKQLRSQHRFGVDKPIFSEDYARMLIGYDLIDTNVMPFGFKTVDGYHSEIMLFKRKEG
ncbi:MAG: putative sugar O-methyltransferase [Thiomicrospira sp.]